MKRYLVGGAVRDELLGRPVRERDWVVVGATEDEMKRAGYVQLSGRIPVFLDPECREEHALARLEKKVSAGHKGFLFTSSPEVTLEEDLSRRDLTINAIARDESGALIDPCGGQEDLRTRRLRHISPAFAEDPLRVLRVARFAAELDSYGFAVVPPTLALMQRIVQSGELQTLPAERIWRETERAMRSSAPQAFFEVLQQCGALPLLFVGLQAQLPQALSRLRKAVDAGCDPSWRWAALVSPLDEAAASGLQRQLRPPGRCERAAGLVRQCLPMVRRREEMQAEEQLQVLERADAFRRPDDFADLLLLGQALRDDIQVDSWRQAQQQVAAVKLPQDSDLQGAAYGEALRQARLRALASAGQTVDSAGRAGQ